MLVALRLVSVIWLGSANALADDEPSAFRVQLAEVVSRLDDGDYRTADRTLRDLLERDRDRDEAVRAGDELLELVTRCAFGLSYRAPNVAQLLGAESASFNRRSRRLEVRFSPASVRHEEAPVALAEDASAFSFHPQGLELVDGVLLLDIPFSGRCQIAINGTLPEHKKDRKRPPQLVLVAQGGLSYTVDYTWPSSYRKSRGLWSQGTVYEWKRGVSELLATDPTPGGKYGMMWGDPYDLKLVVKSRTLVASLQGYGMLSVPKERRAYGRLGLRWCPSIQEVSLSGIVDRNVFDALLARHRERAYAAYLDSGESRRLAPAWLIAGAK